MRYLPSATALAATLSSLATLTTAQCNNQVAAFNPNLRTMSSNSTWFIVPVPKAAAQRAVDASFPGYGLTLLDVPSDPNVFPDGFPSGFQPVLVTTGYTDDIRISALQIDGALPQGTIYVTYVSKNGSPTPLAAQASSYSKSRLLPFFVFLPVNLSNCKRLTPISRRRKRSSPQWSRPRRRFPSPLRRQPRPTRSIPTAKRRLPVRRRRTPQHQSRLGHRSQPDFRSRSVSRSLRQHFCIHECTSLQCRHV